MSSPSFSNLKLFSSRSFFDLLLLLQSSSFSFSAYHIRLLL
uniref:Uncharacterized protein n=1 Tax=Arabidopsis thaliana TaxID=3702 RepID=Q56WG8_ARATH|nr:hypothetical protein [Arabidopsis thaliana]